MTAPYEDGLDVGIVAYRCRELLAACLDSLAGSAPARPIHVVVVDNDSRDGTAELVRAVPNVALIEPHRNLGFAAATNLAIRSGRARYFLALNPDTRVHRGTLDALLALMDADPSIAICGPRLVREDGSFDHAARRAFPTALGAFAHFTRVGRRPGARRSLAQYRAPEVERGPVDAVSGAFMLIRRSAVEKLGLFDEGYWLYMEDLDLCYRAAEAGFVTWYEPAVSATHVKGGTSGRHRRLRANSAFHHGMARFYRSHYAPRHRPPYNVGIYAGIALKFAVSVAWSALARRFDRAAQLARTV
jgi:GT2 family glycosyltransferase